MSLVVFGMVLPWLLVAIMAWLGYQFLEQIGRILLRLEAVENQLKQQFRPAPARAPSASGLSLGCTAPDFELPDLAGALHTLAGFRGRRVLLMFFNPRCSFCTKMMPDLAALNADAAGSGPVPLVVTTGDLEENRRLFQEHAVRCTVLLQKEMQLSNQYQANGTPMGYLVDAEGKIASALAVGADALLVLAAAEHPADNGVPAAEANGHDPKIPRGKANRGLDASRINRNGLKAGTIAPVFCLPRLDGGELSLEEFKGRRVLLVFSDPQCGPCDQLAPHLERFHRQASDPQVLMVSRRDPDANRAKAAQLGLTFPIVLQKQWEISLLYGMFATPIAYVIDGQGVLASDVTVGVEPILALASASEKVPTVTSGASDNSSDQTTFQAASYAREKQ
jgi:peroxiredoxin